MALKSGPKSGILVNGAPGEGHYLELMRQWRWIDFFLNPAVIATSLTTPPPSPADGDAYLVPTGSNGAWSGQAKRIARWSTDIATPGWEYITPIRGGVLVYSLADSSRYQYNGTDWTVFSGGGGGSSAAWGSITGTLSSQSDLASALAGKADDSDVSGLDARLDALEAAVSPSHSQTFGDGTAANFFIDHNLGTRNVHVTVFRTATPWDTISCDVSRLTANRVELYGFVGAPTSNEYTVVVSK